MKIETIQPNQQHVEWYKDTSVTEVLGIIDIIRQVCSIKNMVNGFNQDSLDSMYDETITLVVYLLSVIPVNRVVYDEATSLDTAEDIASSVKSIVTELCYWFHRDPTDIETEVFERMNKFPVDTVRQSYALKLNNLLN